MAISEIVPLPSRPVVSARNRGCARISGRRRDAERISPGSKSLKLYVPVASVVADSVPLGPLSVTVTPANGDSPWAGVPGVKLASPEPFQKKHNRTNFQTRSTARGSRSDSGRWSGGSHRDQERPLVSRSGRLRSCHCQLRCPTRSPTEGSGARAIQDRDASSLGDLRACSRTFRRESRRELKNI